ncbi:uncharacterized protein C8Q71DRAFT_48031 [Rhodofomes roseus]|uniref:Uncharacterized protein n=1 Tax=Rhodofomes roseus TaxID=34475 RepID=A0ABQ8KFK8_9APHY|nr:uncharacterized protein C8Q71DRAFT_48031 [Rhodofomes roseus]KAH9836566.1 hypothetical protein C8Q71DRAFT_48031 [Rhodofomes roseus]
MTVRTAAPFPPPHARSTFSDSLSVQPISITAAGLPWLYLRGGHPKRKSNFVRPQWDGDYEIGAVDDPSWSTLQQAARDALSAPAAFDFSAYLL